MKVALALVLTVVFSANYAQGCERDLLGTWKSDNVASMSFNRANAKLQPKTDAFLAALLGHMTLTFTRNELHEVMPDIEVPVSGHPGPFAGSDKRKSYNVLFCDASMIVWSAKRSFGEGEEATTFNFVDADTFWIYTGSTEPKLPDLHAREYFRRVR
jgi:hypothetical protein